jgi:hypothetical protein
LSPISARAEVKELKIAKQYGISYLPLMIVEADQLEENILPQRARAPR